MIGKQGPGVPTYEPVRHESRSPCRATAVIVAAGRGERFGVASKCMASLAGRPLLTYSIDAAVAAQSIDAIVIVAGAHTRTAIEELVAGSDRKRKPLFIVNGGAERQHSVARGLAVTQPGVDVVVIHDAARPLVDAGLFDRCVSLACETGAAIVATPVVDTVKRVRDGRIVETVPRDDLWAAQTPQAFRRERLAAAFDTALARDRTFTDEAGLFEALGWAVEIVPGSASNIKITVPADLAVAEALLATIRESGTVDMPPSSAKPGVPR